jgi:hypothetical protein
MTDIGNLPTETVMEEAGRLLCLPVLARFPIQCQISDFFLSLGIDRNRKSRTTEVYLKNILFS